MVEAMITIGMAEALTRKALRAIEAQRPEVKADYEALVEAGAITILLRADGLAVMVALGGIPLCDASLDELRREAVVVQ